MLKLTTPKLLIVLAVLVGIFLISRYTDNKGRSKSLRAEIVSEEYENVTKIEILESGNTTKVYKEGDQWYVDTDQGKRKADESAVRSTISTLNSIKPSRIAGRSESNWTDFAVDSTGTRIKVYQKDDVTTDVVLGRFGVEGQRSFYTYVRVYEDVDTYVASNFMKMSVNTNTSDFRNSTIVRVGLDSLASIAFNYPDSSLVLTNTNLRWYAGENPVDSTEVANYLRDLGFISSTSFSNRPEGMTPDLNVTFGFSNQDEIQVSAFQQAGGWIIGSSENEEEFWQDPTQFEKIFKPVSSFRVD